MCSESGGDDDDDDDDDESGNDESGEKKLNEKKLKKKKKKLQTAVAKETTNGGDEAEKETLVKDNETNKPTTVIQIPKRVQSIFFKNLPVNSSRLELEEVDKNIIKKIIIF